MVEQQHAHAHYGHREMQRASSQHMYASVDDTYQHMDSNTGIVTISVPSETNANHWQARYDPQAWHGQPSGPSARSTELYSYQSDRHGSNGASSSPGSSMLRSPHYDLPQTQSQPRAASGLVYAPYDPSALDPHMRHHQGRAPPPSPFQHHHPRPHLSVLHASSHSTGDPSPPGSAWSLGENAALSHHMRPDGVEGPHSRATRSESWPGSFPSLRHTREQEHRRYEEAAGFTTSYATSNSCPPQSFPESTSQHEQWRYDRADSPHAFTPATWPADSHATQHQQYPTQQMKSVHSSAHDELVSGVAQRWQWNEQSDSHLQPQFQAQHYPMRAPSFHSGENQDECIPPVREERTPPGGEQTKSRAWWNPSTAIDAVSSASAAMHDGPGLFSGQLRKLKGKLKTRKAKGSARFSSEEQERGGESEGEREGEAEGEGEVDGEGEGEGEGEPTSADDPDGKLRRRKISEASREYAQRRYRCELCVGEPRMFARPSTLKIHMLSHTKLKPHCCPECNRCFSIPSNLTRHRKLHSAPAHKRERDEDGGARIGGVAPRVSAVAIRP
ncbi:BQ2448_1928 [Microbotryum intermedium]|uniref:pH-response transcription factor pacC/RIM101 n=1 Tax=Microbotryum intermedium TaxID=269621 RepID=A0A238FF88_9BASI|nr:BQ2448_1928 [Microbotryum intermedium]